MDGGETAEADTGPKPLHTLGLLDRARNICGSDKLVTTFMDSAAAAIYEDVTDRHRVNSSHGIRIWKNINTAHYKIIQQWLDPAKGPTGYKDKLNGFLSTVCYMFTLAVCSTLSLDNTKRLPDTGTTQLLEERVHTYFELKSKVADVARKALTHAVSSATEISSQDSLLAAIAYSMTLVADKVSTMVKSVPDLTSARTYLVELLMNPWTKSSDACKAIVMAIYQQERGKCILEIGDTSPQWWMNLEKAMEESEKVMRTADQVDQNQGLPNEQRLIAQGHRNLIRWD